MVYLLAILMFALAIAGMAIGSIIAGRRLRGSCGGLAGFRDDQGNPICDACTHPADDCADFRQQLRSEQRAPVHSGSADEPA